MVFFLDVNQLVEVKCRLLILFLSFLLRADTFSVASLVGGVGFRT